MKAHLVVVVVILCCNVYTLQEELPRDGPNVCRDVSVQVMTKVQSHAVSQLRDYCCRYFITLCMAYCKKTVYSARTRIATYTVHKPFSKCCPGFKRSGSKCIPHCDKECMHGKCTSPNHCECEAGYTGVGCEQDINECSENLHGCEHNCKNEIGSYTCSCKKGYRLSANNKTCDQMLHYCEQRCVHGECISPNQCLCDEGYTGTRCDQDIDECVMKMHGCEHNCINEVGSYTCSCKENYELSKVNNKTCERIPSLSDVDIRPLAAQRRSSSNWMWIIIPVALVFILIVVVGVYWKRRTSIYSNTHTEYSKFHKSTTVQYHTFENEELASI